MQSHENQKRQLSMSRTFFIVARALRVLLNALTREASTELLAGRGIPVGRRRAFQITQEVILDALRGIDVISGNVIVIRHVNQIEILVRFLDRVQELKGGSGQSVFETEDAFAAPGQMPFELKLASPRMSSRVSRV